MRYLFYPMSPPTEALRAAITKVEGVAQTFIRAFGNNIANIKPAFLSKNVTKALRSCFPLSREIIYPIT